MNPPKRLKSEFALLDVKGPQRFKLKEYFEKGGKRVPVVLHGWIEEPWSGDDGISIEFGVKIRKVELP